MLINTEYTEQNKRLKHKIRPIGGRYIDGKKYCKRQKPGWVNIQLNKEAVFL